MLDFNKYAPLITQSISTNLNTEETTSCKQPNLTSNKNKIRKKKITKVNKEFLKIIGLSK